MKKIAIIILAAGESSRMGTSKQLLEIKGQSLLERVVELTNELTDKLIIVLGANADAHQKIIDGYPGVSTVFNDQWRNGLGTSIKAGLAEAVRLTLRIDAALFLVCDQPLLSKSHLENIIETYNTSDFTIIASGYDQTEGVPALFDRKHFSEISALKDGEGAKKLIEKEFTGKTVIPFPEGKIDLDTPEDFRNFMDSTKN